MHSSRGFLSVLVIVGLIGGLFATPAAADTASDLLLLQNELRYAIGAPTIPGDPRLNLAAQRHATYSELNGTGGHYETAGLPGYSGYGPRERVAAAGWNATFVSEVATGGRSGAAAGLAQLWHAPYHRLGMMHPNTIAAGWGASSAATVGDFVYDFGSRPVDFVRSPAHGQAGIPASWDGRESPSPLPAGVSGPVGYPIMVVYSGGQNVTMRAAEVVAPGGAKLPLYYAPQQFEYDYQVIIPRQPLAAGTTYHVRFDINVNNRMVTNEWDFTTAGSGVPAPAPVAQTLRSRFVDQTPWPTLAPDTTTQVTLRFRNSGTSTWRRGVAGQEVRLGVAGDSLTFASLASGWPMANRVAVQSESTVGPGEIGTFSFTVRAPAQLGSYRIPLRPVVDGVRWLDDEGVHVVVVSDHGYHSAWLGQSAFPTLTSGQTSGDLTVTFRNTGSKSWVRGASGQQANLGIVGDDRRWAALGVGWATADRPAIQNEATVAPGGTGTFTFRVVAPTVPGTYLIALRPVIDGTTWMEDQGVYLAVTVR